MNILVRFIVLLVLTSVASWAQAQSFTAIYQPVQQIRNPELRQLQTDWRENRLLEGMADQFTRQFKLSQPLKISLGECGSSNAYYRPDVKAIVLCLELITDLAERIVQEQGSRVSRDSLNDILLGAFVFVVFHELGHAIIDIENLPVLGRNEDAADQISTYLILQDPALAERGVAGGLFFFSKPSTSVPGFFSQRHMSGEHALNPQRAVNLACAAYGKEPSRFVWAMRAARATVERGARCAGEWAQLDRSVRVLLGRVFR